MEFQLIQCFLTVARSLNFKIAANELNVSPATVTRHIAAMEKELNLLLFLRDNRNVKLTASGAYLYQEFKALYDNYLTITENAKKIFEGYNGELTFGILEEISLRGKLQNCIHMYLHKHPNHNLNFQRHSFKGISDGLLDGSLDFGVTFFFDIAELTSLQYKIIQKAPAGILISSKNSLSKKTVFSATDFKNQNFIIMADTDSRIASNGAIDYCIQHGFYPKLRFASDLDTAMLWVEAGMGIAFTYENAISALNPSMSFVPFPDKDTISGSILVLAWNPKNMNPAIKSFLKAFDTA